MTRRPLLVLLAAAVAFVAGVAAAAVPVGAQAGAGDGADFPRPVVAPVLSPAGSPPALAVTSFNVADGPDGGAVLEVRFAAPVTLADAFRYRLDLRIGRPGGVGAAETRVSFVVTDGGEPEGVVEVGNGSGWDQQATVAAALDGAVLTLGLPPGLAVDADTFAWLDLNLTVEEGDAAQRFVSPLFPADQVLAPTGAAATAARSAWGSTDRQPPAPAVELGPAPVLRLEEDELVVEFRESVPRVAGDRTVVKLVDVVRIADGFAGGGAAPYLIAIDHELRTVSLLDGTINSVWPPSIDTDGDWLVAGFPDRPLGTKDQVRVDLPAVLAAFGLEAPDDLATDQRLGLGLARSAQLQAEVGEPYPVRSDGVLVTARWLADPEAPAPGVAPTAPTTAVAPGASEEAAAAPGADDESSEPPLLLIALGCLVVLAGTAAFLGIRWWEHRRRVMASGPVVPIGPPPEPTEAEREELAEFTRQLFDDRS